MYGEWVNQDPVSYISQWNSSGLGLYTYACLSVSPPAVGRNMLVYEKAGESQTPGCILAIFFAVLLCVG